MKRLVGTPSDPPELIQLFQHGNNILAILRCIYFGGFVDQFALLVENKGPTLRGNTPCKGMHHTLHFPFNGFIFPVYRNSKHFGDLPLRI